MRHGLLGELRVGLVAVRDEGDAARGQHADAVQLAPGREVARHDLLDVVGDVDPPHVEGAVLPLEGAHAAHVVAVVAELVPPEAVRVAGVEVRHRGEAVQVFAVGAFRADSAREEEAEVGAGDPVRLGVSRVPVDVTSVWSGVLG